MPRNTTSSDSNKMSQKRDSAEHISPDPLTKDVSSTVLYRPKPQPEKLKPINNTENKEISCSVLPGSTKSTASKNDKVNTCQNNSEEILPVPHIPPASEQFYMHSEESTNEAEKFQSNMQ